MSSSAERRLPGNSNHAGEVRLAEQLRFMRVSRGWSQRQLAARAELNPSTISRIESGTRGITSISTLSSIALALGCNTYDLLGEDPLESRLQADTGLAALTVEPVRRALFATTLRQPPLEAADPLPFVLCQVEVVRERRRQCDFQGVLGLLPSALTSLHVHLHGSQRAVALPHLIRLCLDGCMALAGIGDLSTAWILGHRCADAAALDGSPAHRALASLAVAGVALRQRADDRSIEVSQAALDTYGPLIPPTLAGLLHLTAAVAGGRGGLLSPYMVRDHLARAEVAAASSGAQADPFGLVLEPALVPQARFHIAVQRDDLATAERRLHEVGGNLCREPAHHAAFLVDLARYHLKRGEHQRSLDVLVRCEQTARQYAHYSPEAARLLAQLAAAARTDTLRRRVSGTWQRFRQVHG